MACLIPDELPPTSTLAHRRFAAMVVRLPNGCVIYHQAGTDGLALDFVLISPRLGIIAFDVMACPPSTVITHPTQRAPGYLPGLAEAIQCQAQANPGLWRSLHVQTGPDTGKLRFPINRLVVMTEITSAMVANWGPTECGLFQGASVIPADVFAQWEALTGSALSQAIGEHRPTAFHFDALRGREVDTIRGALRPENSLDTRRRPMVPPRASSTAPSLLDALRESWANRVRVLTAEQEVTVSAAVRKGGHHLVVGPPGSGKTIVLARAAGRLAEVHQRAAAQAQSAILVLTYNKGIARALSTLIREQAGDLSDAIEVRTFHAFVRAHYGIGFQFGETDAAFGELVLAAIADAEAVGQGPRRYRAILIDEAQTWDGTWLKCAIAHLSGHTDDCLVLAGDGGQQLYGRGSFTWKSVGFHYHTSRRHLLTVNRRCPREIQALATPFAAPGADNWQGGQGAAVEDGAETATILAIPPRVETAMPSGYRPHLLRCRDGEGEIDAVLQAVRDALEGRWRGEPLADGPLAPSDIGILYPRLVGGETACRHIEALATGLNQICDAVWITPPSSRKVHQKTGAITIQTIHSATGLEYRLVIVIKADVLPWQRRDTRRRPSSKRPSNGSNDAAAEEDRMLMYIAMTRSTELLMVTWSGTGSDYTQRLLRAHLRQDHAKPP